MMKPTIEHTEERAFLVYMNSDEAEDEYAEMELEGLCEAANLTPCGTMRQRLDRGGKATFIGKGKVQELKAYAADANADIVIFDGELTGIQMRNLQEQIEKPVADRTQLILDIFARRAKTREGMLQVELAQLTYMLPRLMSVYTKFERQRGGIGMRGPGETKLETDRRMVRDKIAKLGRDIDAVTDHRVAQRMARQKQPYPTAAIVGYTSAGKSTLMNKLCGTDLLADAMPFATLDPTVRKIDLPEGYAVFLSDTVGFIRNLPTHLVAAFKSTLAEATFADVLLHVIDVSIEEWEVQRDAVLDTLAQLGAEEKPVITVFNKIDLVEDQTWLRDLVSSWPKSVAISAHTGEGMSDLLDALKKHVQEHLGRVCALIPYDKSSLIQQCYNYGRVVVEDYREDGIYIEAELVPEMQGVLKNYVIQE